MILFLYGPDSFRIQKRLNILRQGFIKKYDKDGFNVEVFTGEELQIENFRKAVLSGGLFSKKRLIVIKNIFTAKEETRENVLEDIKKIDKDNILIVTAVELPKNKTDKLFQILQQADKVEEFDFLKPGDIFHWIQDEFKKRESLIDSEATRFLQEAIGNDLWRLSNEINKLASYKNKINKQDVDLFIDSPLDDNIFNFTDALSNKNAKKALELLHDQIDSGANEFYLITMLARQIRILLQVKESNGVGLELHPFVIKKALPQSNKFSMEQLKKLFSELTIIDEKLKKSQGDAKLLLDMFVVNMCK